MPATIPIDQLIGKKLGKYQIKLHLGRGHVSAVYLAQVQEHTVMLTVFLLPDVFPDNERATFLARFEQEASLLLTLHHPAILPTNDAGEQFGYPYLVTPFVEEGSLAKFRRQQEHIAPSQILELLKPVAAGLDYAHAHGVVHGALKPAHILLDSQQSVRITGFGLTRMLMLRGIRETDHPQSHLLSVAHTFLGSPKYIAPEVVVGALPDVRADVYALGIMLYELLGGVLPFSGSDPFEVVAQHLNGHIPVLRLVNPTISEALSLVVQQALERDPQQRFSSVGELSLAFTSALNGVDGAITKASFFHGKPLKLPAIPAQPAAEEVSESDVALTSRLPLKLPVMPPPSTSPTNWFEEEVAINGKWHLMSPDATGYVPIPGKELLAGSAAAKEAPSGGWQLRPPIVTSQMSAIKPPTLSHEEQEPEVDQAASGTMSSSPGLWLPDAGASSEWLKALDLPGGEDLQAPLPIASQALVDQDGEAVQEVPDSAVVEKTDHALAKTQGADLALLQGRRKMLLLAGGGIAAAGALGLGGFGLARLIQSLGKKSPPSPVTPVSTPHPKINTSNGGY